MARASHTSIRFHDTMLTMMTATLNYGDVFSTKAKVLRTSDHRTVGLFGTPELGIKNEDTSLR